MTKPAARPAKAPSISPALLPPNSSLIPRTATMTAMSTPLLPRCRLLAAVLLVPSGRVQTKQEGSCRTSCEPEERDHKRSRERSAPVGAGVEQIRDEHDRRPSADHGRRALVVGHQPPAEPRVVFPLRLPHGETLSRAPGRPRRPPRLPGEDRIVNEDRNVVDDHEFPPRRCTYAAALGGVGASIGGTVGRLVVILPME
jgi:hypothetical protein